MIYQENIKKMLTLILVFDKLVSVDTKKELNLCKYGFNKNFVKYAFNKKMLTAYCVKKICQKNKKRC